MNRLKTALQYLVPQHGLSHLAGRLATLRHPRWLKNWAISAFVRRYGVNMSEAEHSRPNDYVHFNAFFTRALRPEKRPVDDHPASLISPADGCISALGQIENDTLLQAKGHTYSLTALLGNDTAAAQIFHNGHFITIYLAPRDYHRVHLPLNGTLRKMTYVPGQLFSVNDLTSQHVPNLFARNERVINYFMTSHGLVAVVMVGAMIVGSMATVWHGRVQTPHGQRRLYSWEYDGNLPIAKGGEIGHFQLGSTVILLLPPGNVQWKPELTIAQTLRMGQAIAHYPSGN